MNYSVGGAFSPESKFRLWIFREFIIRESYCIDKLEIPRLFLY